MSEGDKNVLIGLCIVSIVSGLGYALTQTASLGYLLLACIGMAFLLVARQR